MNNSKIRQLETGILGLPRVGGGVGQRGGQRGASVCPTPVPGEAVHCASALRLLCVCSSQYSTRAFVLMEAESRRCSRLGCILAVCLFVIFQPIQPTLTANLGTRPACALSAKSRLHCAILVSAHHPTRASMQVLADDLPHIFHSCYPSLPSLASPCLSLHPSITGPQSSEISSPSPLLASLCIFTSRRLSPTRDASASTRAQP